MLGMCETKTWPFGCFHAQQMEKGIEHKNWPNMGGFSMPVVFRRHQTRKYTHGGWFSCSKLRWGVSNTKNAPIWARFSCLASWCGAMLVLCHWWWWGLFGGGIELLNLVVSSSTSTWLLHMDVELQTTKFPSTHSQPPLPWQHQHHPSQ